MADASLLQVSVTEENRLIISLEPSDVLNSTSVYVVKITGESKNYFFQFEEFNSTLPTPLVFNASYHGLYYIITLMVVNSLTTRPAKSVTVLTKPLPVSHVVIHDYKPSPETGAVFEVKYPEKFNVFTRVNISYWEGSNFRTMLYKDFFKGKTIFNHWLPGTCYSNITFQLVSEASFNKSTLVEYSGIGHVPQYHRTVPYPPQNISIQIMLLNHSYNEEMSGERSEDSLIKLGDFIEAGNSSEMLNLQSESSTVTSSYKWTDSQYRNKSNIEITSQPSWWTNETGTLDSEGFVNEHPLDHENPTATGFEMEKSAPQSSSSTFKVLISWLPPKVPTAFDGFLIYILKDGNTTTTSTVDESTHEFVTELEETGKYKIEMTTFSSSGLCTTRESSKAKVLSFYISPGGEWFEELTEKPKGVGVKLLNSSAALVTWRSSPENSIDPIISVTSQTCTKQKESQRLEKRYCTEVNSSSNIISGLVPGAQYKVVVHLQKTPLIGPPSDAVIFALEPPGIKDLVLYPLEPSAVVLSWARPYHSVFRKYIVEMFYFNPLTMSSEWSPYYEIAATISLSASVRVANLLPAWYYNFRVTMVTWGDPELRCCDNSTNIPALESHLQELRSLWVHVQRNLQGSMRQQKFHADHRRLPAPSYLVGERACLSSRNLNLRLPTK
ncbi:receptor-type tyrosine-protein phosphatase O-like [Rhinophrynus dorsalis]